MSPLVGRKGDGREMTPPVARNGDGREITLPVGRKGGGRERNERNDSTRRMLGGGSNSTRKEEGIGREIMATCMWGKKGGGGERNDSTCREEGGVCVCVGGGVRENMAPVGGVGEGDGEKGLHRDWRRKSTFGMRNDSTSREEGEGGGEKNDSTCRERGGRKNDSTCWREVGEK